MSSLFREKIPVVEHKELLAQATEAGRLNLVAFANLAKVERAEAQTDEQLVTAITAALGATATLADENVELEANIVTAEKANGTLTAAVAAAKAETTTAQATIDGVTALFGESAKADGFNLVKAVGDIVPEPPTGGLPAGQAASKVPAAYNTPLDDLNAKFQAREITASEFYKQSMELEQ